MSFGGFMQRNKSKALVLSVCLNAVMFLVLLSIAYYKRDGIKSRVAKILAPSEKKIENLASAMNHDVFEPVFGRYDFPGAQRVIKVGFLGNSLTFHGAAEKIGWNHESGMAASSLENDYVHKTVRKLAEAKGVSVEYALINVADFERGFETFDFSRLSKIRDFPADFLVFQLGENVISSELKEKYDVFVEKYSDLVRSFENPQKIVCIPFWHDNDKVSAITQVSIRADAFLVDLSHLGGGLDSRNYASSEVKYKHRGVGLHPGDFGMENIADNIFSVLNAML